jgi:hypothetical protein
MFSRQKHTRVGEKSARDRNEMLIIYSRNSNLFGIFVHFLRNRQDEGEIRDE